MRQRKTTTDSSNSTKSKPKSIGKLFGYIKSKIKNGIEELTSVTSHNQNTGKQQQIIESPNTASVVPVCPIPRPPRKSSHSVLPQKPINVTHEHEQLLSIQVQKCYKNIPQKYFKQDFDIEKELFSKSPQTNNQKQFQLEDFLNQVQFNISELVAAKPSRWLVSMENMSTMNGQIIILMDNIKELRKSNQSLKSKLTGKVQKINKLQKKSQSISRLVAAANSLKLLTYYPRKIKQIIFKDKSLSASLFKEYLQVHERYKIFCGCCDNSRTNCQLQNIRGMLQSGFQQTFSKSYWNYITEGLLYEQNDLKNIFGTKKDFQSMPGMTAGFSLAALLASGNLDQSICDEQKVQLVIKENVEQEIKKLINVGLSFCKFDNQNLLANLQQFMEDFEKGFLSDILSEIKQSFMINTDNHLVTQSKSIKALLEELGPLIKKLKMSRFLKIVDFYSSIVQKAIRRSFSVLYRVSKNLKLKQEPEQFHIQTILVQVCLQLLSFVDKYLTKFIQLRQVSQQLQLSTFRDLVSVFESWQNFGQQIQEYFIKDLQSQSGPIRSGICKFGNLQSLKIKFANQHFKGLHNNTLSKQLKNGMQQDPWIQEEIDPKYYNILGYILQGQRFNESRKKLALLNSSLYLDKKPSVRSNLSNFSYFGVNYKQIIINEKRFRPTSSLLLLLSIMQQYLKMNEIDSQMTSQVSAKLVEMLYFYNYELFQLILNAAAIHYNKVGGAITIKHLCLSYHAVSLVLLLLNFLKPRIETAEGLNKLIQKIASHQKQIIKKIQSTIPYRIQQQLKHIALVKPSPSKGIQSIVSYLRNTVDTLKQYFQEQEIRAIINSNMLNKFIQRLLKLKPKNKTQQELLQLQILYFISETQFLTNTMAGYETLLKQLSSMCKISKF